MVGSDKFDPRDNLEMRRQHMEQHKWHEIYVLKKDELSEQERLRRLAKRKQEIQSRLASFHKGSMTRSGTRLMCYITGMSFSNVELTKGFEPRMQVMRTTLRRVGVPDEVISFLPPSTPVPTAHVKADGHEGEAGDAYREAARQYQDEARENYNNSMSNIMKWCDLNDIKGGSGAVSRAVTMSERELRWVSEKAASTLVVPVDWGFPSMADRKKLFNEIDKNGNGFLSLAELDLAVRTQWTDFNHREALIRAYKLADMKSADGKKDGFLSWNDDEKKCEFSRFLKYLHLYVDYWRKFTEIDIDQDGCLERDEWRLKAGNLLQMELTDEELDLVFDDLDADGGGRVRFDEFCAWAAKAFGDMELQQATEIRTRQDTFKAARATATWYAGPARSGTGRVQYGQKASYET